MSQSKIYVGNLPYNTTNEELEQLFSQCGSISEVKLITDRETGRSKGFAFVTFDDAGAVAQAIQLNGNEFNGRNLKVSEAKERTSGGTGGRGGRGAGGFGGGGGGRNW